MMDFEGSTAASIKYENEGKKEVGLWLNNIKCTGKESTLLLCGHHDISEGLQNCKGKGKAGVKCKPKARLVGDNNIEPHGSKGRVEVVYNGTWRKVCGDSYYWDFTHANIVCRQLGFPGALVTARTSQSRRRDSGLREMWFRSRCEGNETEVTNCYHDRWSSYCSNRKEAYVTCITARLVGGQTPSEGLVQVYHNNTWGWVCADHWNKRNADVACRMMDFNGSLSLNFSHKDVKTNFKVLLNKINCFGNESSLFECRHDGLRSQNCEPGLRKAGVICRSKVRLVGGRNVSSQGRVELFYNGTWGTVCGQNWKLRDANVVCHQLGFEGAQSALIQTYTVFGRGKGNIWYFQLRCIGNESSLTDCGQGVWYSSSCSSHYDDAGVVCRTARLVDGRQSPREGLVQVYYNKTWGWVCADQWDKKDADVACRMMDFNGSLSAFYDSEKIMQTNPAVWLNNMQCTGNESSLFFCKHGGLGSHDCKAKAGVICRPKVRLVGWSNDSFQGRVEVYVNGTWGGVCGYHNYWDLKDANVVCRQLGFKGAIAAVTSSDFPQNNLIPNLQCKGNETSLTKCEHVVAPKGKYCSYNRDACVVCIT
ncbi:unnamed protein product, partial [Porites lobata]